MAPKRKNSSELSSNQNTKKARTRLEKMNPVERQVEKAKQADQQAVTQSKKKLLRSEEYLTADSTTQAELIISNKANVLHQR